MRWRWFLHPLRIARTIGAEKRIGRSRGETNMTSPGEEWGALAEEYEAARDAEWKVFAPVNRKFRAIGSGASMENPSMDELRALDEARARTADVQKRMDQFMRRQGFDDPPGMSTSESY